MRRTNTWQTSPSLTICYCSPHTLRWITVMGSVAIPTPSCGNQAEVVTIYYCFEWSDVVAFVIAIVLLQFVVNFCYCCCVLPLLHVKNAENVFDFTRCSQRAHIKIIFEFVGRFVVVAMCVFVFWLLSFVREWCSFWSGYPVDCPPGFCPFFHASNISYIFIYTCMHVVVKRF